jgi:DNA-binding GntR family transcriptional regulator
VHAVAIHALVDLEADMVAPHGLATDADRAEVELAHAALIAAVELRDGARAYAIMKSHITDVQRRLAAGS